MKISSHSPLKTVVTALAVAPVTDTRYRSAAGSTWGVCAWYVTATPAVRGELMLVPFLKCHLFLQFAAPTSFPLTSLVVGGTAGESVWGFEHAPKSFLQFRLGCCATMIGGGVEHAPRSFIHRRRGRGLGWGVHYPPLPRDSLSPPELTAHTNTMHVTAPSSPTHLPRRPYVKSRTPARGRVRKVDQVGVVHLGTRIADHNRPSTAGGSHRSGVRAIVPSGNYWDHPTFGQRFLFRTSRDKPSGAGNGHVSDGDLGGVQLTPLQNFTACDGDIVSIFKTSTIQVSFTCHAGPIPTDEARNMCAMLCSLVDRYM